MVCRKAHTHNQLSQKRLTWSLAVRGPVGFVYILVREYFLLALSWWSNFPWYLCSASMLALCWGWAFRVYDRWLQSVAPVPVGAAMLPFARYGYTGWVASLLVQYLLMIPLGCCCCLLGLCQLLVHVLYAMLSWCINELAAIGASMSLLTFKYFFSNPLMAASSTASTLPSFGILYWLLCTSSPVGSSNSFHRGLCCPLHAGIHPVYFSHCSSRWVSHHSSFHWIFHCSSRSVTPWVFCWYSPPWISCCSSCGVSAAESNI